MPPSFPTSSVPPVVWAVIAPGGSGDVATEGPRSTTIEWLIRCNRPDAFPSEIVAQTGFLPPRGDPLRRFRPNASGIIANGQLPTYSQFEVVDANQAVAGYSFRQHTDDPQMWSISIRYEEATDPTTMPAEFSSDDIEYQDHVNVDIHGRPVENSARDLMIGGMPVDHAFKLLKLTRCLPYHLWNSRKADEFRNTLNRENFYLSRQTALIGGFNVPLYYPPGSVRLKKCVEQELVRSPSTTSAGRKYYWKVSVDLHVDMRTIRQPDGREFPVRHRFAYADAGFRRLGADGLPTPIFTKCVPATEQQLLDFKGQPLAPSPYYPDAPPGWVGSWPSGSVSPQVEWSVFEAMKNVPLIVSEPGVLKTAYTAVEVLATVDIGPAHGTLSLSPLGGFTYTPSADYSGWDRFTYTPTAGEVVGTPVTVFILVRPEYGPWWQMRDRYPTKSWAPLSDFLVGW